MTCAKPAKVQDLINEMQRKQPTLKPPVTTKPQPIKPKPTSTTTGSVNTTHTVNAAVKSLPKNVPSAQQTLSDSESKSETDDNTVDVPFNVKDARAMFENNKNTSTTTTNKRVTVAPSVASGSKTTTSGDVRLKPNVQTRTKSTTQPKTNGPAVVSPPITSTTPSYVKVTDSISTTHDDERHDVVAKEEIASVPSLNVIAEETKPAESAALTAEQLGTNVGEEATDSHRTDKTSGSYDLLSPEERAKSVYTGQIVTFNNEQFRKLPEPGNHVNRSIRKPVKPPVYDLSKFTQLTLKLTPSSERQKVVSLISEYDDEIVQQDSDYDDPSELVEAIANGNDNDDVYDDVEPQIGEEDDDEIYEDIE